MSRLKIVPAPIQSRSLLATEERSYKVITPIFGGGVEPMVRDPISVVRVPSVIGHLRFWWRAVFSYRFKTIDEMAQSEESLFGAASKPSSLRCRIVITNAGKKELIAHTALAGKKDARSYVTFPAQDKPASEWQIGVEFQLQLEFPADQKEYVEGALWAWENFGGIGGRTRRGCGALSRLGTSEPIHRGMIGSFNQELGRYIEPKGVALRGTPRLPRQFDENCFAITGVFDHQEKAWKAILSSYRDFRQNRNAGHAPDHPGRSKWPEADALRLFKQTHATKHAPDPANANLFPRAIYGLPIVFHFKDHNEPNSILYPEVGERRASPLLLRPVKVSGGWMGMGLVIGPQTLPGKAGSLRVDRTLIDYKEPSQSILDRVGISTKGPFRPILDSISKKGN